MAAYLSNISKIARAPVLTSNLNRYGKFAQLKKEKKNCMRKKESKSK